MEKEEAIDLGRLLQIMIEKKKTITAIILICTLIAVVVAFVLPKTYESTTLVQTRSGNKVDVSGASAAMAVLGVGGGSMSSPTMAYIELMKSRSVLDPVIAALDIPADMKEKMNINSFAKSNLDIQNTKGTNLITITGKGRTPEEAQQISQGVVDNFLLLMTNMNQQTQSLMVKFLNDRILDAKKDSDASAKKLEEFSKDKKVYGPTDQTTAELKQMAAFDKMVGDLEVKKRGAQAQFDSVSAQLDKQNANLSAYNIADNAMVQGLREKIVAKQVELVGLQQKYQDKHPAVITAQQELEQLQSSLTNEVSTAVAAGTATMNPVQAELMKNRALASTDVAVSTASEVAVKALQKKTEGNMSKLSEDVLEYTKLERDAKIKNEIYLNLVKQCEQAKIQQAMESMDVQIVDVADLPRWPSAPRKTLIALIGLALGCVCSFIYTLIAYKRG